MLLLLHAQGCCLLQRSIHWPSACCAAHPHQLQSLPQRAAGRTHVQKEEEGHDRGRDRRRDMTGAQMSRLPFSEHLCPCHVPPPHPTHRPCAQLARRPYVCIVDVVDASCICTCILFYDSESALPDSCAKTLKKTARLARLASRMLQLIPGGHRACLR